MTRDPVLWILIIGGALSLYLLALVPMAISDFGDGVPSALPCPKSFKDPRCTSEMAHAPRNP